MRVANLGLLAILLLTAAHADDEVTPPAAPSAEQEAAASAAPTERAEPVSEAARDEQPQSAPEAASRGSPEKAPEAAAGEQPAEPASAGAAPNAPETSEKSARADDVPLDTQTTRLGYTPKVINGEKRYCKETAVLGSRLNKKTICWSTEQLRNHQESVDEVREKAGQRQTYPRP